MNPKVDEGADITPSLTAEERRRLYNEAVRQSNLVNILLSDVDFKVDREKLAQAAKPEIRFSGSTSRFALDAEQGRCLISVRWKVDIKDGRKTIATCSAVYDIAYDGFSTSEESVLRIFADNVARSATYSYFRSLFATLDWASNLRTPPLPVLKLFPKV